MDDGVDMIKGPMGQIYKRMDISKYTSDYSSSVYQCSDCGKRTRSSIDAKIEKEERQKYEEIEKVLGYEGGDIESDWSCTSDGNIFDSRRTKICGTCRVRKYRGIRKNPYLSMAKTGKMPQYIKRSLHNKKLIDRDVVCATYTHHWLCEYCISENCLRKAHMFGYCRLCYKLVSSSTGPALQEKIKQMLDSGMQQGEIQLEDDNSYQEESSSDFIDDSHD